MILEIDAGNTFIKWRCRRAGDTILARGRWLTAEFSEACLGDCPQNPQQVWASSVAGPGFEQRLSAAVASCWQVPVRFARTAAATAGVRNSYADPSRMGVDRWLVMLAAWQRHRAPCCIVDCGSAITVDLLDARGWHEGGYILPGLRLMRQVLEGATAGVQVDREISEFDLSPGRDTSSAVVQGTNMAFAALAHWLEDRSANRHLLVTGGDGQLFHQLAGAQGEYVPDLVLDGLRWALE